MSNGKFFALCIAISVVLLLVVFRIITGTGFGFQEDVPLTANELVSSGFLFNLHDNFQYVSFAEQARHGLWLFSDLYTTESHPEVYFNLYFLMVGRISRAIGVPVVAIFVLGGIIGAGIIVFTSFYTAVSLGFPVSASKWACLFVAFASGLYSLVWVRDYFLGAPLLFGADVIYHDAFLFSTFFAYPYHTVSVALMVLLICCIAACQYKGIVHKKYFFLIPFLALFLSLTRPFEITMLLLTYGIFVAVMRIVDGSKSRQRLLILLLVAVGATPILLYQYWVSQQPVWSYVATYLSLPRAWVTWIVGYGGMLPLAAIGGGYCLGNREYSNGLWFVIWVCLLLLLLTVLQIPQTKVCSGGHFPMCVLAGLGFSQILTRAHRIRTTFFRFSCLLAIFLTVSLSFVTSFLMLAGLYRPVMYDSGIQMALRQISEPLPLQGFCPKVLCDSKVGLLAPALASVRVYVGNGWLTPAYESKRAELVEAGVEPMDGLLTSTKVDPRFFRDLLDRENFNYVLLNIKSPADSFVRDSDRMRLVGVYGHYALYKVNSVSQPLRRLNP